MEAGDTKTIKTAVLLNWLRAIPARFKAASTGSSGSGPAPSGGGTGSKLPEIPAPKVKPKQVGFPSYAKGVATTADKYARTDRGLASTDIPTSYRTGTDSRTVIRDLAASTPDLAAALSAYLRVALTQGYKVYGRNMDGTLNVDATQLANEFLTRFDIIPDYADGFAQVSSLRSTSEALGKEIVSYGAMALELVLDKARIPKQLVPVSTTQLEWYPKDKALRPVQKVGSDEVDLDIPTFFYVSLDQNLLDAYASSPLEPAIQPILADMDFLNDLRRVLKRAIHPRLNVSIDEEALKKTIPPEILHDPEKLKDYLDGIIEDITSTVNDLSPEDALVHFKNIEFAYIQNENADISGEYETIQAILNAKVSTGAKTLPSILGHGSGSQNIASSETLMFMKQADGLVRVKLNEIYSRALTLAVRLMGLDCYVQFEYDPIDLRPVIELESFKAMEQSRVLDLLSLGFVADEEASIRLTGRLPGPTYKPLSGTYFRPSAGGATPDPNGNHYSTTGTGGNAGGAMNQSLKPSTPTQKQGSAPAK